MHSLAPIETTFRRGAVVAAAGDLMGVQTPDGALVPCERLGPGVVEQLDAEGRVNVRWVAAGFDAWLEAQDLRSLGPHAHLITVMRRDKYGRSTLLQHKVAATSGFEHNWTVEFLPGNVVRSLREDSAAWTFSVNPLLRRVNAWWPQPPDDDDAEALAAAELSLARR
jgi:hypothetical protein